MDMHFEGMVFQTHAAELARRIERPWPPFTVLDVRGQADHERERVPGSRLFGADGDGPAALPPGTTERTEFFVLGKDPDDPLVRLATGVLRALGARRVVEIPGGLFEWKQLGLPLESGAADPVG